MSDAEKLLELLRQAVDAQAEDGAFVAFSGGLDSSLLALLASGCANVRLITIGMGGSHDLDAARAAAGSLGLRLETRLIGASNLPKLLQAVQKALPEAGRIHTEVALPLYALAKAIGPATLLSGQGADELFGGYHRYLSSADLKADLEKDVDALLEKYAGWDRKVCSGLGVELRVPFLDAKVVEFARNLPPERKVAGGKRKIILQEAARLAGLPNEICSRKKKAIQYGTGISRALRKINI